MKRAQTITWEQLKVGAIIAAALAILMIAIFRLGEAANLFATRYELVTFLESANGLREGGAVTVAGQVAGSIQRIDFLPPDADTTRNLRVTIEIAEALQEQIREDSRARLRTLGLLGDRILDLSPGTPRYAVLQPGDTVPLSASLDYEAVIARASGAVGDMVELTRDLRNLTGGMVRGEGTMGQLLTTRTLYDRLSSTLTRMDDLLERVATSNGTVGRLLDDPTLYERVTDVTASLDSMLRQVNSGDGTLGKLIQDDTLYTRLVGIATGADSLLALAAHGDGLAARLLRDQELYDKLTKSVTDLNAILADVRANPRKYTKGMIKVF